MKESGATNPNTGAQNRRKAGLNSDTLYRAGAVVVVTILLAVVAASRLPTSVVVLWDESGHSAVVLSKPLTIASVLVVQLGLLAVFTIVHRSSTVGDVTVSSPYQLTVFAPVSLVLLVFPTIVTWNSGLAFGSGQPLSTRVGALLAAVLLYGGSKVLPEVEQNRVFGIRSPWTMADEEIWDQTHAHAAPFFKAIAVIAALAAAAPSATVTLVLIVVPLLLVLAYLYYYSYRLYDG